MGAAAGITGGMSFMNSIFDAASSFAQQEAEGIYTAGKARANAIETLQAGREEAASLRMGAWEKEGEALDIARETQVAIDEFDRTASRELGAMKAKTAASGVEMSGSALMAIEAAEDAVARQRMARQTAGDSKAAEREYLAATLRLNAQKAEMGSRYKARSILSSADYSVNYGSFVTGMKNASALMGAVKNFAGDALKGD